MSIVTPIPQNTVIKVYAGIPWDDTLRDVRLFDTSAQRDIYFNGKLKGIWEKCSIVSMGKSIKVEGYYNNFLECNYLTFTNQVPDTTARTIYAFITSISYVNVNTVQIDYTIDWIQTYLFDFEFDECMVEREHVNSDAVGEHLLDEGLDTGEYMIRSSREIGYAPAVFVYYLDKNVTAVSPINGVASCLNFESYTFEQLSVLATFLDAYKETPERIVEICMGVSEMRGDGFFSDTQTIMKVAGFSNNGTDVYTPRNNKLSCYPFMLLAMDNFMGEIEQLRWEEFQSTSVAVFTIKGNSTPKPCMEMSPANYKGRRDGINTTEQFAIQYSNFPSVPYATDAYRAWISQYGFSKVASVGASVVGTVLGAIGGGIPGLVTGGVGLANAAIDTYQEVKDHKIHSQQVHGSIGNSGMQYAKDEVGFRVTQYAIRREYAERIDKYFDRYGYRVSTVKVPNVRGRQFVNYVKTNGAIVSGNVAVDAKVQMERALDQGVSFWHTDAVGAPLTSNPIV